jgi:hypothetical protein
LLDLQVSEEKYELCRLGKIYGEEIEAIIRQTIAKQKQDFLHSQAGSERAHKQTMAHQAPQPSQGLRATGIGAEKESKLEGRSSKAMEYIRPMVTQRKAIHLRARHKQKQT